MEALQDMKASLDVVFASTQAASDVKGTIYEDLVSALPIADNVNALRIIVKANVVAIIEKLSNVKDNNMVYKHKLLRTFCSSFLQRERPPADDMQFVGECVQFISAYHIILHEDTKNADKKRAATLVPHNPRCS